MPRHDLLALTQDDLVTLTNRGIVKRAVQEAEGGELTAAIAEDDAGTVTADWSDDIRCVIPAGKTVRDAECSCPATTLCRHIIRTVLAYQTWVKSAPAEGDEPSGDLASEGETSETTAQPAPSEPTPASGQPWDPGTISDEVLDRYLPKTSMTRARKMFDEGQLLELVRAAKPTARNHTQGVSVRFLVPGDPRYTHCDCGETAPCIHTAVAVWAFRLLPQAQESGLISTKATAYDVPEGLMDRVESLLMEIARDGFANLPAVAIDRIRRLEAECRDEGMAWPADILADLALQRQAYVDHDSRFDPGGVGALIGELCIRMDAIRNAPDTVPQLFVRGAKSDRLTETGSARLIGLGCDASVTRSGVRLSSFMQDVDSGMVVAVRRDFGDPDPKSGEEPKPLWSLATAPVFKGTSLGSLGTGQMLVKGGKRSPNHEFSFGRAPVSVNGQAYRWESLRAPLLAESFHEVAARLVALPPAMLRPRRLGEDLHVCPIAAVESVRFDSARQCVVAAVRDHDGGIAEVVHPYTSRGREGTELLLEALTRDPAISKPVFIAGDMRLEGTRLSITPVSLVLEGSSGRTMIQPWIGRFDAQQAGGTSSASSGDMFAAGSHGSSALDPATFCTGRLADALSELFLTGLGRGGSSAERDWTDIHRTAGTLGFVRILDPISRIGKCLEHKRNSTQWEWHDGAAAALELAVIAAIA